MSAAAANKHSPVPNPTGFGTGPQPAVGQRRHTLIQGAGWRPAFAAAEAIGLMTTIVTRTHIHVGPNLLLVTSLCTLAYLLDLLLTITGHAFVSQGFHELNPMVSTDVDTGHWALPVLGKCIGLCMMWAGFFYLRRDPHWAGMYSWVLGVYTIIYILLDTYQVVNLS